MDTAVIIQIVEAIVAAAAFLGLGIVTKLYKDSKVMYEAWLSLYSALKLLADEIKKANEDKNVTQEEFDEMMEQFGDIMAKAEKLRESVQVVVDDVYKLKEEIMDWINNRQSNNVKADKKVDKK